MALRSGHKKPHGFHLGLLGCLLLETPSWIPATIPRAQVTRRRCSGQPPQLSFQLASRINCLFERGPPRRPKGGRVGHPRTGCFGISITLSWIFWRNDRHRRCSENRGEATLLSQTFTFYKRDLRLQRCLPLCTRKSKMTLNYRKLVNGEGRNLKSA